MPDKQFGERICAYVQCKPGMTLSLEEMIADLESVGRDGSAVDLSGGS